MEQKKQAISEIAAALRHEANLNPILAARSIMQLAASVLEGIHSPPLEAPDPLVRIADALERLADVGDLAPWMREDANEDSNTGDEHTELAQILAYRDRAYQERNRLVCLVARLALLAGWRAGTWRDPDGEPGFALVVGVELPTGQVSFHMDERDPVAPWMALPTFPGSYDGHTDVEKWDRLLRAVADIHAGTTPDFARRAMQAAALDPGPVGQLAREHLRIVRGELDRCPECGNPEGSGPASCKFCSDFRAGEASELTAWRSWAHTWLGRVLGTAPESAADEQLRQLIEDAYRRAYDAGAGKIDEG